MGKTLKQIAEIAGTSIATVSKVVNKKTHDISDETVKRVEAILKKEGYQPNQIARTMKTNKTKTIGLLIPDIRNPFFTEIARGAEDAANEAGYTVFLCNTDDNFNKELKYLSELNSRIIDGIIIAGSYERHVEQEEQYIQSAPMVAIDRVVSYPSKVSFITTDNFKSSRKLTQALVEMGHSNYIYIGGPIESDVTVSRYEGFVKALKDNNINSHQSAFGKYSVESGYELILQMESIPKGSAIVCGNDLIALGVLNGLKLRNLEIPHDVSVTGFDNIDVAQSLSPSLSTINQPTYEMGKKAAETLIDTLQEKNVDEVYTLVQDIVLRDSTKNYN